MSKTIDLAEVGTGLSEAIENAIAQGEQLILSRGGAPIAVVSPAEPHLLASQSPVVHPEGLAAIVGKWENFEEIEPFIEEAYRSRQNEMGRPVDLD